MNEPAKPPISKRSELMRCFHWLFSWRGIRRLLIVLAWTATLIALWYGVENWRGRGAWKKYRQELEARGEQLDLKSFIPKPVADEQNFAATPVVQSWFTKKSRLTLDDDFSRIEPLVPKPIAKTNGATRRFVDLVAWERAFAAVRSGKLEKHPTIEPGKLDSESRAKAAPSVLDAFKADEDIFTELRNASSRPYCRYPVNYDLENPWGILIPHLQPLKALFPRLRVKACAELAAGQSAKALEDMNLMFYLADSVKDEPFLISFLVRLACVNIAVQPLWEGLAEHRWSEAQLQELQTRFQKYDFVSDAKLPLRSERATGILTVDLIREKGLGILVALDDSPPRSSRRFWNLIGSCVPRGWYDQEQLNYCRLHQQQLAGIFDVSAKGISPTQIKSGSHELEREIAGGKLGRNFAAIVHHHVVAALLLPSLDKSVRKAAEAQTVANHAGLACALERYRLANGQFPDRLEALAPQFMPQLPNDVLTGEPYKYRRTADAGFLLYSIGWDEKDDGGVPGKYLYDETSGDWVW